LGVPLDLWEAASLEDIFMFEKAMKVLGLEQEGLVSS